MTLTIDCGDIVGLLTTDHPSSYGQPVLVINGRPYAPTDIVDGTEDMAGAIVNTYRQSRWPDNWATSLHPDCVACRKYVHAGLRTLAKDVPPMKTVKVKCSVQSWGRLSLSPLAAKPGPHASGVRVYEIVDVPTSTTLRAVLRLANTTVFAGNGYRYRYSDLGVGHIAWPIKD